MLNRLTGTNRSMAMFKITLSSNNSKVIIASGINCFEVINMAGDTVDGNVRHKSTIREKAIAKLRANKVR